MPLWVVSGALVVLATAAYAQTLPVPTLPPEAPPESEPPPTEGGKPSPPSAPLAPLVRPPRWEYELGVGGFWDSNIDFVVPEGRSGAAVLPRAGLARTFRNRHASLRLGANGSWYAYPEHNDANRYYGGAGLESDWRSSRSTSWRVSASYDYSYSDSSSILVQQGIVLPLVKTRSLGGTLGFEHQMARKTKLRAEGRVYRTDFDTGSLQTGQSYRGTVALDEQLSAQTTGSIVYAFEATLADYADLFYYTHFGSLQLRRTLSSSRAAFLLEAGASYTPESTTAGLARPAAFFGGATFSRKVKSSSLGLYVRREVVPAFGLGTSALQTRLGLWASIPLGTAWWLSMSADSNLPDNVGDERVLSPGSYGYLSLGRRLWGHLTVSGEAWYRRRGETSTLPTIDAVQAGMFLTLTPRPGGAIRPRPVTPQ